MAYNTVKVKKYSDVIEEIEAGGTITPGMLLELDSSGEVIAHNSAGENVLPMFALEDALQGDDIDDDYSSGDKVQCWIPYRGDIVYAILANGNDVSVGDFLESAGGGELQKHAEDTDSSGEATTIYTNQIVGVALEDVESTSESERILVRII